MKISNEKVLKLLKLKLETVQRIASPKVPEDDNWSNSERKDNAELFADKLEELIIYLEVLGDEGFEFMHKEIYKEFLDNADFIFSELSNRFCGLSWISYRDDYGDTHEHWITWVAPIEEI